MWHALYLKFLPADIDITTPSVYVIFMVIYTVNRLRPGMEDSLGQQHLSRYEDMINKPLVDSGTRVTVPL